MNSRILDLGEDLSGFLATLGSPIEQTARELIVFELYRRSLVSSGKAAELLGILCCLSCDHAGRWLSNPVESNLPGTRSSLSDGEFRGRIPDYGWAKS